MNFYGAQYRAEVLHQIVDLELRAQGVNAAVTLPHELPQVWSMLARGAFGTQPREIRRLADSLAEKAGVEAVSVHQTAQGLVIVLAKPEGLRRVLTVEELLRRVVTTAKPLAPLAVPVGLSVLGEPVLLDLADARSPHLAILGATGSGKSELARWLLWWLARRNGERIRLLAYSPKRSYDELHGCTALAHPPVRSLAEVRRLLAWISHEMARRMEKGENDPPIVALFDEVPLLVQQVAEADDLLSGIASAGREVGIHLVLLSQQATKAKASQAMDNMPARLVGRVASGTLAYVTSGKSGTEVDKLLGRGDFHLVRHDTVRVQAPLLQSRDWTRLEHGAQQAELELPVALVFEERRGGSGWNAADVDEGAVQRAFREGRGIRDIMSEFGIGFARAKRLQEA